jgi:hypothetical protein
MDFKSLANLSGAYQLAVAFVIMALSSVCLLYTADTNMHSDVRVYAAISGNLLIGKLPYRDVVVEYPPYAPPIFLLPRIFLPASASDSGYMEAFMAVTLLADWMMKLILYFMFCRCSNVFHSLLPLLLYSVAIPFLGYFFLQRYDIWPALTCAVAIWLFCSSRVGWSGLVIAIGIGMKAYPVFLVPPLLVLAWRRGKDKETRRFVYGLAGGILPILLMGFFVPWWRFAQFQSERGLQAESIYATLLWAGRLLGWVQVNTVEVISRGAAGGWREVHGPLVSTMLPCIQKLFFVILLASTLISSMAANRCREFSPARLARILLLPLLGFVAFNQILSPQYVVWLLPLAAIGSLDTPRSTMLIILSTALFDEIMFHPFYRLAYLGFDKVQTTGLIIRNLLLITAWGLLFREMFLMARRPAGLKTQRRANGCE